MLGYLLGGWHRYPNLSVAVEVIFIRARAASGSASAPREKNLRSTSATGSDTESKLITHVFSSASQGGIYGVGRVAKIKIIDDLVYLLFHL